MMGIILDTNCFSPVFSSSDRKHKEFKPVLDYVLEGIGKFVYGGSKYFRELKKAKKYSKILSIFNKYNKCQVIEKSKVDKIQKNITEKKKSSDFDDPHLAAIVIASRCYLICTEDARSHSFLKDKSIYPKGIQVPKFYSGKNNMNLLAGYENTGEKLNKKKKELIKKNIKNVLI